MPSVPLWTIGIDVENATHEDFTRKTNPDLWDKTQLEINRFRLDCAAKYSTLLKNDKLDKEIEIYDTIRSR